MKRGISLGLCAVLGGCQVAPGRGDAPGGDTEHCESEKCDDVFLPFISGGGSGTGERTEVLEENVACAVYNADQIAIDYDPDTRTVSRVALRSPAGAPEALATHLTLSGRVDGQPQVFAYDSPNDGTDLPWSVDSATAGPTTTEWFIDAPAFDEFVDIDIGAVMTALMDDEGGPCWGPQPV